MMRELTDDQRADSIVASRRRKAEAELTAAQTDDERRQACINLRAIALLCDAMMRGLAAARAEQLRGAP